MGVTLLATALAACNRPPRDDALPEPVSIQLYPVEEVPDQPFSLQGGQDVEIQWPIGMENAEVWLVYHKVAGGDEGLIVSSANGGPLAWVVPRDLLTDTDYDIRAYRAADGTLAAQSAVFTATGTTPDDGAGTNGIDEPSFCTTNADCDDGLFCNGVETCDTGTGECLPGTPVELDIEFLGVLFHRNGDSIYQGSIFF